MKVCTTAINVGGLRTTHHLPQQDHLLSLALKANKITLDHTWLSCKKKKSQEQNAAQW